MNESERIIRDLKRDHKKLLNQFDAAIAECTLGTNAHTRLLEARSKQCERYRNELVRFGLLPENVGAAAKSSFHFVSHVSVIPANAEEARKLAQERDMQALLKNKLYYSDEDEAIRK